MLTILIHIDSGFKFTPQVVKSEYLTLISFLLICEGVWKTKT